MSGRDGVGLREVALAWRWGSRPHVPRSAEPYRLHHAPREFSTAWARTPAMRATRAFAQAAGLKPLVWSQTAPAVEGLDVFDGLTGPVLFVANHGSHLDAPLLLCSLPPHWRSRTAVTAAADYFFHHWWRAVGTALVFATVPVERRGGTPSSTPGDLLADGWNLVVFPEGTRSADGRQHRFRLGAAHLSTAYDVPVVPVGIRGSVGAMPRGRGWPIPGRPAIGVRYGRPTRAAADEDVRAFTRRLAVEVARLVDEDASTWWESLRRSRAAAAEPASPGHRGPQPEVARWRRVWAATEPTVRPRARSPWE